jgi:hypothetical protein
MKYKSIIETRGKVPFPEFTGERAYMVPFTKKTLPAHLARWQDTVDAMLDGIDMPGIGYIMIDQSIALSGNAQRRPGLHIDGYWNPGLSAHGGDSTPSHSSIPSNYGHGPNPNSDGHGAIRRRGGHNSIRIPTGHSSVYRRHSSGAGDWATADFNEPEGIILASSVSAARGFVGSYDGPIGEGGDCSSVDIRSLKVLDMEDGVTYAGNVNCLHESLPLMNGGARTLVRINAPGWSPT